MPTNTTPTITFEFDTTAVAELVTADAVVVLTATDGLRDLIGAYDALGTLVLALPNADARGFQAAVVTASGIAQARLSRAMTIASYAECYDAYVKAADKAQVEPGLTGYIAYLTGKTPPAAKVLTGQALITDRVKRVNKVLDGLNAKQRAAVIAALSAE
jgi:hypothetical protein